LRTTFTGAVLPAGARAPGKHAREWRWRQIDSVDEWSPRSGKSSLLLAVESKRKKRYKQRNKTSSRVDLKYKEPG